MSTKTLRKRIALVAVSALGFGILSAVPSNAAIIASPIGTVKTISLAKTSATTSGISTAVTVTASFTLAAITAAADGRNVNFAGALISAPSNGQATVTTSAGTSPTVSAGAITQTGTANVRLFAYDATGASAADAAGTALFNFTPLVAGTYVLRVWHDVTGAATTGDGIYSVGETFQDLTITVGTAAAALPELGNAAVTAVSTGTNLVGMIVPSVGATIDEVSGRVGQMVGFAPHYFIKRNAGSAAASADTNTAKANLNYAVTNPAGTAVSVVTAKVAGVASTEQNVAGDAGALTNASALVSGTSTVSTKGAIVYFATATAGTYTITVWHDADANDLVSVGEASATKTVVIAADALPSITFTKYGSNTPAAQSADGGWGQLCEFGCRRFGREGVG